MTASVASATLSEAVATAFPGFSLALREALLERGVERCFGADDVVMAPGSPVRSVPLILEGAVEVTREEVDGEREVLLYYLEPGQTCAASLACCAGGGASSVRASAARPTRLLLVPVGLVERWMGTYPTWRTFVLATYTARFDELLGAVDALAFDDLRARLVANLAEKRRLAGDVLALTHRQLAAELNTSRVVVTRLLRALEREGAIAQARGEIRMLDDLHPPARGRMHAATRTQDLRPSVSTNTPMAESRRLG